jgi:uncharacterized protein YbaA (DUF1428 family)
MQRRGAVHIPHRQGPPRRDERPAHRQSHRVDCLTAAALAACTPAQTTELPVRRLVATDLAFSAPPEAEAGLTRIRLVNQGAVWHEAVVVLLDIGATLESHVAGRELWVMLDLAPGHDFLGCGVPEGEKLHAQPGMLQKFRIWHDRTRPDRGRRPRCDSPHISRYEVSHLECPQFAPRWCARCNRQEVEMRYVDGFVLPVPKKNMEAYRRMARKAGEVWRDHGAVEYLECVGDDLKVKIGVAFPKRIRAKPSEKVFFSFIVYKSRAHRDRVNKKVMKDPRLASMMDMKAMPFDMKRMMYGGFKVLVDL